MKRYVLFNNADISNLILGNEIKHNISGIGDMYFMSKEEFIKRLNEEEKEVDE